MDLPRRETNEIVRNESEKKNVPAGRWREAVDGWGVYSEDYWDWSKREKKWDEVNEENKTSES